jgi:hypothetical protein
MSVPLVSVLAILRLWRDTGDTERIANHAEPTFWYVLPSLPMFLVFPFLLRSGTGFWSARLVTCILTVGLNFLTVMVAARFGVRLQEFRAVTPVVPARWTPGRGADRKRTARFLRPWFMILLGFEQVSRIPCPAPQPAG